MVNPAGTGNPMRVISAKPAPLPPSKSFISPLPSAMSASNLPSARLAACRALDTKLDAQTFVGVPTTQVLLQSNIPRLTFQHASVEVTLAIPQSLIEKNLRSWKIPSADSPEV